jgi:hypothetical protein
VLNEIEGLEGVKLSVKNAESESKLRMLQFEAEMYGKMNPIQIRERV